MLIYAAFTHSIFGFKVLLQGCGVSPSNPEDIASACKSTVSRDVTNSRGQLGDPETRQQEQSSASSLPLSQPSWHPSALARTFPTWAHTPLAACHSHTGIRSLGCWVTDRRDERGCCGTQLQAGGMLMFRDYFPRLGLLWGCCGSWERMQQGLQRGFVHGVLPTLADPEFGSK